MAANEPRDWIDRAIAEDVWEPPTGFAERVAMRGRTVMPRPVPQRRFMLCDFVESLRARIDGSRWVLRQYRKLLLH